MDSEMLETFTLLSGPLAKGDWKKSLDSLFGLLRKYFVFDNLVIYLADRTSRVGEAVYARAAGRGRSQEADASWGEEIANQVISTGKAVSSIPAKKAGVDRVAMPYMLALPLELPEQRGALVFIRFGGPEFTNQQMPLAALAVVQVTRAFEQQLLQGSLDQLDHARHRAQLQDDFIATISHEVHTPLGFIKGYTTSLLRSDTTWDQATQHEFLTIIDEESDHLITLIDRMLDSARLQTGNMPMDFQSVRLDSLIRDAAQRLKGRHKDLIVELNLVKAPPIMGDTVRLVQVFNNLFENAIKYAPGSPIAIKLQVKENMQIVTVSDKGPGIPAENIPFLFERFYRASAPSGKSGAGLGLSICKQIIQAHHGQISVKTTLGRGTSFLIELPVANDRTIRGE
jgi:signal transduction histidine kinase